MQYVAITLVEQIETTYWKVFWNLSLDRQPLLKEQNDIYVIDLWVNF